MEKGYPLPIIDGKGYLGGGSVLDIVNRLNQKYNRKVYVINLSDPANSDKYNPPTTTKRLRHLCYRLWECKAYQGVFLSS